MPKHFVWHFGDHLARECSWCLYARPFSWVHLAAKVYVNELCIVGELKEHTGVEIGATDEQLLWAFELIFNLDCKKTLHTRESI